MELPLTNTPDDAMIDLYSAIIYAGCAESAAILAVDIAARQNDTLSWRLAEKAVESSYCAAGFVWRAKMSDGVVEIRFCVKDTERAKNAAITCLAQVLEAALDIDPSVLETYETNYRLLLSNDQAFNTVRRLMIELDQLLVSEGLTFEDVRAIWLAQSGQEPLAMPNAEMIEVVWNIYRESYPDAFLVPNTLTAIADDMNRKGTNEEDEGLSPEALADAVAAHLAAERGPEGECRYCEASLDEVKESITKGRCVTCDHALTTEMMAGLFDILAYDPETGQAIYGPLPDGDDNDDADGPQVK